MPDFIYNAIDHRYDEGLGFATFSSLDPLAWRRGDPEHVAQDPRFAIAIYPRGHRQRHDNGGRRPRVKFRHAAGSFPQISARNAAGLQDAGRRRRCDDSN